MIATSGNASAAEETRGGDCTCGRAFSSPNDDSPIFNNPVILSVMSVSVKIGSGNVGNPKNRQNYYELWSFRFHDQNCIWEYCCFSDSGSGIVLWTVGELLFGEWGQVSGPRIGSDRLANLSVGKPRKR